MIKKIKKVIKEHVKLQRLSYLQLKELEWSQIFHDSIRGKKALETLPLNVGRWAGNYTFFYLLNRILTDYKPNNIIEFGLGESTKFISTFISNYALESKLVTIEHDENWKNLFLENFQVVNNSKIELLKLTKNNVNGYISNGYHDIAKKIKESFDLYIIDGPFGSPNYSRYDIFYLLESKTPEDEFIIIMDDYERIGEKETTNAVLKLLKSKQIKIYTKEYVGNKSVFVIATEKYQYVKSL